MSFLSTLGGSPEKSSLLTPLKQVEQYYDPTTVTHKAAMYPRTAVSKSCRDSGPGMLISSDYAQNIYCESAFMNTIGVTGLQFCHQ